MKIIDPPKTFHPITIQLETQEELDELFALLNRGDLDQVIPNLACQYEKLDPYTTTAGYKKVFDKFTETFVKRGAGEAKPNELLNYTVSELDKIIPIIRVNTLDIASIMKIESLVSALRTRLVNYLL